MVAAAIGADELRELMNVEPGFTGEAGWSLGKAEAGLIAIRAIAKIAGMPQIGEDDNGRGWGHDTHRFGNAASYLHALLKDLADDGAPARWLREGRKDGAARLESRSGPSALPFSTPSAPSRLGAAAAAARSS